MHNSCLGISPKYFILRNASKPIIDLCGIGFLCANFETFTIFSASVLKTCTYPPYYELRQTINQTISAKGPVKLIKPVNIADSFLQSVSNQFHVIILSLPM